MSSDSRSGEQYGRISKAVGAPSDWSHAMATTVMLAVMTPIARQSSSKLVCCTRFVGHDTLEAARRNVPAVVPAKFEGV
jgi:hypothetical protein